MPPESGVSPIGRHVTKFRAWASFFRNSAYRQMKISSAIRGLVVLLFFLNASKASSGANWPQWRGPNGNGIVDSGNPPVTWSEAENIRWKVPISGKGHATPIIWGDQVFVLTVESSGADQNASTVRGQGRGTRDGGRGRTGDNRPGRNNRDFLRQLDTNGDGQVDENEREAARRRFRNRGGGERNQGRGQGRGGFGGRGSAPTSLHTFKTCSLDRKTGKLLWETVARKEIPHQGVQRTNTYGSGSPVTDGEHLYVSFGSYGLYCYDLDGGLVWEKDLGKVSVTFGEGASPALHGETLIVVQDNNGDSFIYAFHKRTGEELWKKSRDERSGWTTPYIMERDGKTQVLVSGSNAVRSYDIKTGEVIWQCSGLGSNPVPMIVADENAIYAMSGHRQPYGMAVKMGGTGDLTETDAVLWTTTRGTPYVPSPLLYDGLLFYCQRSNGILTCVDAQSGKVHYGQERLEGMSGVYSSPVGVGDRIYLPGQNGATVVFKKSKALEVMAVNRLDDQFDASPAVIGNELFLRGNSNLYCIAQ